MIEDDQADQDEEDDQDMFVGRPAAELCDDSPSRYIEIWSAVVRLH